MKAVRTVVRSLLAHRLDRDVATIHPWQRLDGDLDLQPLTLVLVALDVEEKLEAVLPIEQLASLETVGDLATFVSRAVVRGRHHDLARV